jgi:hypothetical protein
MLPDLVQGAGTELDWQAMEGDLLWGAMLGQRTHQAAAESPVYQEVYRRVRDELGIFGAARYAQAGLEWFLDGAVLQLGEEVADGYRQTLSWLKNNYEKVGQVGLATSVLTEYLDDFADRGVPGYLTNIAGLAGQFRNQFDIRQRTLNELLIKPQDIVCESASNLISDVMGRIRQSS